MTRRFKKNDPALLADGEELGEADDLVERGGI